MIDLVAEPLHDPFQLDEVEDEPALFVERTFDRHTRTVVVPVQTFAAMARKGDEVRRREYQVVLGDRNAELTAQTCSPSE